MKISLDKVKISTQQFDQDLSVTRRTFERYGNMTGQLSTVYIFASAEGKVEREVFTLTEHDVDDLIETLTEWRKNDDDENVVPPARIGIMASANRSNAIS